MQVLVKLFAHYRDGRFKQERLTYDDDTCLQGIINDLAIDESILPVGILLINGKHAQPNDKPKNGDTVSIFPKVGGG